MVTTTNTCTVPDPECPSAAAAPATVTFADIKPIIVAKCASCHLNFADYLSAKPYAATMLARISLASTDASRMPLAPNAPATADDIKTFTAWVAAGTPDAPVAGSCTPTPPPPAPPANFESLDYVESAVLADLQALSAPDRASTRYLITTHRANEGLSTEAARQALDKAVNGLNPVGTTIVRSVAVDAGKTIWRINCQSLNISQASWQLIVKADPFQIESFTTKGALIKQLSGSNEAWLHADNFIDITYRNSDLYYTLLGVPKTFAEFALSIGATLDADAKDGQLNLMGFNGSSIAGNKNRMGLRNRIRVNVNEGYLWTTQDVQEPVNKASQNLFQFPLIAETGGKAVFGFAASETINSLPNGLQQYGLWLASGTRLGSASTDVVHDTTSPLSPIINNANSCSRCHNNGINPMVDQVLANVVAHGALYDPADVNLVKLLYKTADVNSASFSTDIAKFGKALTALGITPGTPDPMNAQTDILLLDWNVDRAAAFLLLPTATFKTLLQQSATGVQTLGTLLTGGTVTRDQFLSALPALKNDLRLFQDPLGK